MFGLDLNEFIIGTHLPEVWRSQHIYHYIIRDASISVMVREYNLRLEELGFEFIGRNYENEYIYSKDKIVVQVEAGDSEVWVSIYEAY